MIEKLVLLLKQPRLVLTACNTAIDHLLLNSLTRSAVLLGTDKGSNGHGYTRAYYRHFAHRRNSVRNFLEIGLLRDDAPRKVAGVNAFAPSLQMWSEFFPHARIIGFDICDFSDFKHPRSIVIKGDQSKRKDLRQVRNALKGDLLDIVIDDGLHASAHQQITLGYLFPLLRSGGLYCIEDLHYQPSAFEKADVPKTLTLLKQYQSTGSIETSALRAGEREYLENSIADIELYDSLRPDIQGTTALAVIHKKAHEPAEHSDR